MTPLDHQGLLEGGKARVRTTRSFVRDTGLQKADITEGQFSSSAAEPPMSPRWARPFPPQTEGPTRVSASSIPTAPKATCSPAHSSALYKDEAGRRISELSAGPLFAEESGDDHQASGTIYVLRSKSDHPLVVANRKVLHKIGVTGGNITRPIGDAKLDQHYCKIDFFMELGGSGHRYTGTPGEAGRPDIRCRPAIATR